MSEPVKNPEIEDVLSSIRRLVTETRRQPAAVAAEAKPKQRERLVLTPALRVAVPEDGLATQDEPAAGPEQTVSDEPVDAEHVEVPSEPVPDETPEPQTMRESEEAYDADGQDAHKDAEHHEEPSWEDTDLSQASEHRDVVEEWDIGDAAETKIDHSALEDDDINGSVEPVAEDMDHAPVDEVLAEPDAHDDQPEADTDHHVAETSSEEPWTDPNATLYEAAGLSERPQDHSAVAEDMRPLTEKIAALEDVIAKTDEQWEPDDPGSDDYAGTDVETLTWEDTAEEEAPLDAPMFTHRVLDETVVAPEPTPETNEEETARDEDLLDEDALRDLVADIVRQELQGVLGERITRNVRKLVRREIHRALSVRDLE